jgi:hypothetical protein
MSVRLNAACFLFGLVGTLASLSILGSVLAPPDLAAHFVRFHVGIGIDNDFFATAHDIQAILDAAEKEKPAAAVTVIVGGTSVFQGTSQSEPRIWTERLQQDLGARFRVINLAQRAGRPNDFGNLAAEMLLKQHKPVIYLCDSMNSQFTIPIEASFYLKSVYDAWGRGYLLDWPARDRKMVSGLWSRSPEMRSHAWGARLDRWLNFDGLWSYVAFENGGSVWNKYRALDSITPLRQIKDPEPPPHWYVERGYPKGADDARALEIVRAQIFPPGAAPWAQIRNGIDEQMPGPLRAKTLVVVDLNSPYYLDRLSVAERTAFIDQADRMAAVIQASGFAKAMVVAKDFTDADYADRVHLSVEGGEKLADRLTPEISKLAAELGETR